MTARTGISAVVRHYLSETIWHTPLQDLNFAQRIGLRILRVLTIVVRDFGRDNCLLRASALTFTTLLSIVPLLAFAFAVLKGLGVQNRIEPLLLEYMNVGSEAVVGRIIEYINNTQVGRLGTIGLGMLLFTVLALLSNIEESFNYIWGVLETRSILRRFADYFSVLAFGPLLIVVAISLTATIQNMAFVADLRNSGVIGAVIGLGFKAVPYVAMWTAFTFLYLFMPNIRVHFSVAVIGGVCGGTIWQLVQLGYVHFQVGVGRYNAIYGTMAILPIFMVWLYLSWVIVLLGVELTATIQNLESVSHKMRAARRPIRRNDFVGLAVLLCVVRAFRVGQTPIPVDRIATRLDLLEGQVVTIADELRGLGLLSSVEENSRGVAYLPARAPEGMLVLDLLMALRGDLPEVTDAEGARDWSLIKGLLTDLDQAERTVLDGMTLQQLADHVLPEPSHDDTTLDG
jgi:membrane protein